MAMPSPSPTHSLLPLSAAALAQLPPLLLVAVNGGRRRRKVGAKGRINRIHSPRINSPWTPPPSHLRSPSMEAAAWAVAADSRLGRGLAEPPRGRAPPPPPTAERSRGLGRERRRLRRTSGVSTIMRIGRTSHSFDPHHENQDLRGERTKREGAATPLLVSKVGEPVLAVLVPGGAPADGELCHGRGSRVEGGGSRGGTRSVVALAFSFSCSSRRSSFLLFLSGEQACVITY
ncbi:hypothetical protein U9M48_012580 [Paspalum notatum var. saurae]|uniref:Uncharacterized protein n=1 Tax=Paspalum notatum var. saurae TaxID=547442 RepID=A0AAQ3SXU3_PASNO